jgi:hypothetical protein
MRIRLRYTPIRNVVYYLAAWSASAKFARPEQNGKIERALSVDGQRYRASPTDIPVMFRN